jgi:RNA-binding protein
MTLKGSARKFIRGLAHNLSPVVWIGKEGLTAATTQAVVDAFSSAEVIKVKLLGTDREERRALAAAIESAVGCECVGTIGQMAILYREHPEPEKRRVKLPA